MNSSGQTSRDSPPPDRHSCPSRAPSEIERDRERETNRHSELYREETH
jgi:hypothetical protein